MNMAVMLEQMNQLEYENPLVTKRAYDTWRAGYLFEVIKGIRYGQSFCNYFGIRDNILFYDDRPENCHRYICKHYIT
jgi:hypothetical protein